MRWWMKVDKHLTTNSKIVLTGREGLAVYLAVLGMAADRDGYITHVEARPKALEPKCLGMTVDEIEHVIDALIEVEALERLDDGGLGVRGWGDEWRPGMTETEARAERRRRQKGDPPDNGEAGGRDGAGPCPDTVRQMSGQVPAMSGRRRLEETSTDQSGPERASGAVRACVRADVRMDSESSASGTADRTNGRPAALGPGIDGVLDAVRPPGVASGPPTVDEARQLGEAAGARLGGSSRASGGAA